MVTGKIWRVGDSYVVTIPPKEMERQHLREGDVVDIELRNPNAAHTLTPEIVAAVNRSLVERAEDYRYLRDN